MEKKTKGAWLLAHSKCLDAINGAGRLENIKYAGGTGRLYNLLRRNVQGELTPTLDADAVATICQLNNIDRATRESGLTLLEREGRIDKARNGAISVLGATSIAVLETTAAIFDSCLPSSEEQAVLQLSEMVATKPVIRSEAIQHISDEFKLTGAQASQLVDVCKATAILDESENKGHVILFNNNTFRDGQYAQKAYRLLNALSLTDRSLLSEFQGLLKEKGAVAEADAQRILGIQLYDRLVGIGLFDRLEVSNSSEAVGYVTSPDDFQRYGRPFEDDPVDDAKALLASLTYGMTRSSYARGNITMPSLLLNKLIGGGEVGGVNGVRAIGEDYRELEKRQVVKVVPKSSTRFTMKLLKKDVGELALAIIRGKEAAQEAILMDGSAARDFKGPAETRRAVRAKHTLNDRQFVTGALDVLRSGG